MRGSNDIKILGIETSCDDTAIAVVTSKKDILSNVVINQNSNLNNYGGVVPEIAARDHLSNLDHAINRALEESKLNLKDIDLIAATGGPGLIGGVIVGTVFAKSLAMSLEKPYVAVNHLEGHALTARLTDNIEYPYLLLLVSGGHTQIIAVIEYGKYTRISSTLDDAAGETFDKAAKILGIGFPGGPMIEKMSKDGDPTSFYLPRPMHKSKNPNFSFSGLKTAFNQIVMKNELNKKIISDLSASIQKSITDCLIDRTRLGITKFKEILGNMSNIQLVVAGGVASNETIRKGLKEVSLKMNFKPIFPSKEFCGDNAAMIAWAGIQRCKKKLFEKKNETVKSRWPLDVKAPFLKGPGLKF